jgi:hypothetical protein
MSLSQISLNQISLAQIMLRQSMVTSSSETTDHNKFKRLFVFTWRANDIPVEPEVGLDGQQVVAELDASVGDVAEGDLLSGYHLEKKYF